MVFYHSSNIKENLKKKQARAMCLYPSVPVVKEEMWTGESLDARGWFACVTHTAPNNTQKNQTRTATKNTGINQSPTEQKKNVMKR